MRSWIAVTNVFVNMHIYDISSSVCGCVSVCLCVCVQWDVVNDRRRRLLGMISHVIVAISDQTQLVDVYSQSADSKMMESANQFAVFVNSVVVFSVAGVFLF